MENKKIGSGKAQPTHDAGHNVLEAVKPFAVFGAKALGVLASALVHIVKNIPKPDDYKKAKNDKVIKI